MSTVSITSDVLNPKKFLPSFRMALNYDETKEAEIDSEKLKEALYETSYNLLVLENKWVKGIFQFIYGIELCGRLNIDKNKILEINREMKDKGICVLSKRTGIFKKIEYQITGFWDY